MVIVIVIAEYTDYLLVGFQTRYVMLLRNGNVVLIKNLTALLDITLLVPTLTD